jgi:adenylosuccinate lyase
VGAVSGAVGNVLGDVAGVRAEEIRHLQRTEAREVEERFRAGQKGSSATPPKRNPITTERITGLARVLRGNARPPSRTSRCGTSATSRTPAPSA